MTSICTPAAPCDMHRDEPATTASEKCPGVCDTDGCTEEWLYEIDGERRCAECAVNRLRASVDMLLRNSADPTRAAILAVLEAAS